MLAVFNRAVDDLRRGGAAIVDPIVIAELPGHLEDGYHCARFAFDADNYLRQTGAKQRLKTVEKIYASGAFQA